MTKFEKGKREICVSKTMDHQVYNCLKTETLPYIFVMEVLRKDVWGPVLMKKLKFHGKEFIKNSVDCVTSTIKGLWTLVRIVYRVPVIYNQLIYLM